jgi:hypothetical protein
VIVGYGVVALAWLQSRAAPAGATQALGGYASSQSFILLGLGLQFLLIVARALLKRHAADDDAFAKGMLMIGLAADAATVFLFALGTYGAIAPLAREL